MLDFAIVGLGWFRHVFRLRIAAGCSGNSEGKRAGWDLWDPDPKYSENIVKEPHPGGIHKIQVASTLRTLGYPSFGREVLNFLGSPPPEHVMPLRAAPAPAKSNVIEI